MSAADELRRECQGMTKSALRKKAASLGVSEGAIDGAEDAADEKVALIELVLANTAPTVELQRQASHHEDEQARAQAAARFMEDDDDEERAPSYPVSPPVVKEDELPEPTDEEAALVAQYLEEKSRSEKKAGLAAALAAIRAGNVPVPAVGNP